MPARELSGIGQPQKEGFSPRRSRSPAFAVRTAAFLLWTFAALRRFTVAARFLARSVVACC